MPSDNTAAATTATNTANPKGARIVRRDEGRRLQAGPVAITYKLESSHDAGWSMLQFEVGPGFEAPPAQHWHTREHAFFYVLEGAIRLGLGDESAQISAGDMVHLPPGAPFVWSNPGDEPARFLCMYSPAGFEQFFADVQAGLKTAGDGTPQPEAMGRVIPPLWQKYGIQT